MALAEKVRITINGTPLEDYLDVSLQQNIFGHHSLEVSCRRENASEADETYILENADSKYLGAKIELQISSEDKTRLQFEGVITGIRANKMDDAQTDTIVLAASSPDLFMDDGEHCRTFRDKPLKGIVEKILGEYQFSTKNVSVNSTETLPYTVQYKESAFAFLTRLASKKGQWFYYDGAELIFGKRTGKKTDLKFGEDLMNFNMNVKLEDLNFKYMAYNYEKNMTVSSDSANKPITGLHKNAENAYKVSESKFKHETLSFYNHALVTSKEQSQLDDRVKLIKSAIAAGLVTVSGSTRNPELVLGGEVKISETTRNPNNKKTIDHGTYIVTSLSHTCDRAGHYQNSFTAVPVQIDVPPYSSPHAIPFCETQVAKVMDNNDPEKLGRIKVQFLWQEPENTESPWLRILSPHAGENKGLYFIPEIGEEVIVSFEGGNAEKPYVVGSMYHGKAKPESAWVTDKNDFKGIRTRSGQTIEFSDKDGSEMLKIYDNKNQNYVITLDPVNKKITIESTGDIDIKATGNMNIEATKDINIKGQNVKAEASMNLEMKGTSVKNEASGQMEIKGAMAKIDGGGILEQKAGLIKIN
jgi:Rhs element Vgr protein